MADPVPGTFTVVARAFPHPGRTPMQTLLTGYVQAEGVPRTVAEVVQHRNRDTTSRVLPAVIDRADPTSFVVEWDRVPRFTGGVSDARAAARFTDHGRSEERRDQ